MPDVFSKEKRSEVMSLIRGKGKKQTEGVLVRIFKEHGISGWRRHLSLPGNPDFTFRKERLTVFVDGCFWHGCPVHFVPPRSNQDYWGPKIARNRQRDLEVMNQLEGMGLTVIRIWSHEVESDVSLAASRITSAIHSLKY